MLNTCNSQTLETWVTHRARSASCEYGITHPSCNLKILSPRSAALALEAQVLPLDAGTEAFLQAWFIKPVLLTEVTNILRIFCHAELKERVRGNAFYM